MEFFYSCLPEKQQTKKSYQIGRFKCSFKLDNLRDRVEPQYAIKVLNRPPKEMHYITL